MPNEYNILKSVKFGLKLFHTLLEPNTIVMAPSMPGLDKEALSSRNQRQWVREQGIGAIPTHVLLWKGPREAPEMYSPIRLSGPTQGLMLPVS